MILAPKPPGYGIGSDTEPHYSDESRDCDSLRRAQKPYSFGW